MAERDRHLAAVWFADIVGYTELSNKDEDAAFRVVDLFRELARSVIEEHDGRLVQSIGDAVLAEFRSTEAAVQAALALRDRFSGACRELGHSGLLRIGVHLGDVRATPDGDVYGDGVNTASRLLGVAAPGQIVVSQDVWRQIRPRAEYRLESLGERRLKGIAGVVWAFSVDRREGSPDAHPAKVEALPNTPVSRRLRKVVRVGLLYAVAGVLIIGLFRTLASSLSLPGWVMPAVFVLLAVGLLVVLGTAWVESRPAWRQSLTARPTAWDVGMSDLTDSISRRRFPEMTWPRAVWGGVVVFSILLGAALVQREIESGRSTLLRPQIAHAAPSPSVVILPFSVQGTGDDLWAEGILDLMALSVDASRHLRAIDARTVIRRLPDPETRLTTDDLYTLSEDLGARYAITGQLVRVGDVITLQADVYDVLRRQRVGVATVDGNSDRIVSLVELLATRALAFGTGGEASLAERPPLSRLATRSIPALQAYLRGEQLYRRSRWTAARDAFSEAVESDPTFALARYRLALTESWSELPHRPRSSTHQMEAERHVARLAERDSLLVSGFAQLSRSDTAALQTLAHLVRRFPDDSEGWFLLGDARYHLGQRADRAGAVDALREAIRLDPGFGPAYVHLIDEAVEARDTAQVRQLLAAYRRVDPGSPLLSGFDWALQLAQSTQPPTPEPAPAAADAPASARQAPARASPPPSPRPSDLARLDSLALAFQQRAGTAGLDPAAVREAGAWQEAARQARAANQIGQAESHYRRALEVLAAARITPPTVPTPAPAPAPAPAEPAARPPAEPAAPDRAEVAAVLASLQRAIEGKDVDRIRQIWTSLSGEEADRFRRSLPGMRNLRVSFQIQDISPSPGAAVVRVQTTYAFEPARGQPERQTFGQVFRIARPGDRWVIVQSSTP